MSVRLRWMALLITLFVFACSDSVRQINKTSNSPVPESAIQTLLNDSLSVSSESLFVRGALNKFYATRHNSLMWFKKDMLTPQGDSLMYILQRANYYGLIPEDYHLAQISELNHKRATVPDVKTLAKIDVLMTDGLLAMANHIKYGRLDREHFHLKNSLIDIDSSLMHVINQSVNKNSLTSGLWSLEPSTFFYHSLKNDLRTKLDSLSLGLSDTILRMQLKQRTQDLSINMERWRWEQSESDAPYILVNTASFRLAVIDRDSMVFTSNVIVGTPYSQTPTLDARVTNLMLYPHWNVPRNIATKELLPKIKKDSTYLLSNGYRVLDVKGNRIHPDSIAWKKHHVNNFPFLIQQSEGEHNALGMVKFNFVNDFDIYLHDTNAKRLFENDLRALSHGCVRVERAMDLARLLVKRENPYCSAKDLEKFVKAGKQQQVTLMPMDIKIRYYTCQTDENGRITFFNDIYQKNDALIDALYCRVKGESYQLPTNEQATDN